MFQKQRIFNGPRFLFQLSFCLFSITACADRDKTAPEPTVEDHYLKAKRLMLSHKYSEAEAEFKIVLPSFAKSKDDELKYMDSQARLALACALQRRLTDAELHIEPVIQYLNHIHATEEQSELLVVLDELCEQFLLHAVPGSPQEKEFLQKALSLDLMCHQGNHSRLVEIWSRLSACNIALGDDVQARECMSEAVKRTFGHDHHDFSNNMIATLCIHAALEKAHKNKEADQFLQSIIEKTTPFFSSNSESIVLDRLGSAYSKLGDIKEAIKYYEKSLLLQQKQGHDARTRSRTMQKLACAYESTDKQTKADKLMRDSIDILSKSEKKSSRFLFEAIQRYSEYLGRQKRFAEEKIWAAKAQAGIRELIPE